MTNEKQFTDGLLKANGITPHGLSEEDLQALQRILKRDRARVRRMKWATLLAWGVLLLCWVGAAVAKPSRGREYATVGVYILYYVALICTLSFAIRSWFLAKRETQARLTEMDARMARIAEALERIAGKS